MRVFLDTNIVLDVLLKREPFFQASYDVMRQAAMDKLDCYISASAITDIFYVLRKALSDRNAAKVQLEGLLEIVGVADVLTEDVYGALSSNMPDFEDAMVAMIAARWKAKYIVTRNARDFDQSPVPAVAPDALLAGKGEG